MTGTLALSKSNAGSLGVGIGGFGGTGGTADDVTGSLSGDVTTSGTESFGVLAQSQGGGGGNGAINVSGALTFGMDTSVAAAIGVGGFGGDGGASGDVSFTRTGITTTSSEKSDGVTIQSVGGGGGNGGINVSGGIAGTTKGTSATLSRRHRRLRRQGELGRQRCRRRRPATCRRPAPRSRASGPSTAPSRYVMEGGSNGIVAQSQGGGGGNGGINVSGGISLGAPSGSSYGLTVGIGGFGGAGGDADTVDLTVAADDVTARGDDKTAVLAQSVGGGGGNGAINVSGGITMDGALTVGIGGSGGGGGKAGDVTASVTSDLWATGSNARGFAAQSIGGGGGNGGINISGGIMADKTSSNPSLVFGLGGAGGAAQTGGAVTATQTGAVQVIGTNSIGVLAQSVSNGGGSGGLNVSANLNAGSGYNAAIGIGGSGGDGADSGAVSLASDGQILLDARQAENINSAISAEDRASTKFLERGNGILAQSIGGGGGVGGMNVSGVVSPFGNPLVAGVGGSGGGGGNSGAVTVNRGLTEATLLQTQGDQAAGLVAQSVGGGGGTAGMNFVLGASGFGDKKPKSVMIAVGGDGGSAGNGDAVDVTHKGTIATYGNQSDGLIAQSVGGGGGSANFNVGGGLNKNATSFNLAVGGGTGDGGTGANVAVDHAGTISTVGNDSMGILGQSVGGGGGDTAMSMVVNLLNTRSVTIGIGREGGTGGAGGDVSVTSAGTVTTGGDRSTGVMAQSVGNGGGLSGSYSVGIANSSGEGKAEKSSSVGVSVGLAGGEGGTAGNVDVSASGVIQTDGESSDGVHAQSVGGGGGIGGSATSIIFRESASARVAVGGTGGKGGVGGDVSVDSTASILTRDEKSSGITAQSIGGGGGTGGYVGAVAFQVGGAAANGNTSASLLVGGDGGTGADGGDVTAANAGSVETEARESLGVSAQSIGGGGGDGGMIISGTIAGKGNSNSLEIGIGGSGGTGGTGGDIVASNTGTIATGSAESAGLRGQSIGGGGGNGGLQVGLSVSVAGSDAKSNRVAINIGGTGGSGGTSGEVSLTNGSDGQITTEGKESYGIFGQSIGGGGGNGSSIVNITATGGKGSTLAGLNIGGSGGDGNASGDVSVVNGGLVQTTGEGAHGIFAQSVAGGGGNGGLALAISAVLAEDGNAPLLAIGGTGGDGADAGDVTVTNSGQITTSGQEAHGIVAQSIGGGGGNANVGFAIGGNNPKTTVVANALSAAIGAFGGGDGGLGGKVTVNHSGNISVSGEGAQAIKAESINGGGGDYVLDFNGITSLPGGQGLPGGLSGVTTDPVLVLRAGGEQTLNSTAGAVTLNVTGTFNAVGDNGAASSVQAIGGGGGNAKVLLAPGAPTNAASGVLAVRSSLGGKNGTNNKGGRIASALDGAVTTAGNNAPASLLQSIGGGGGRSTIVVDDTDAPTGALTLSLGAKGGSGETGAAVSHDQDGALSTTGDLSVGMLAQSIGGGGGLMSYARTPRRPPPPRRHRPWPLPGWPPPAGSLSRRCGWRWGATASPAPMARRSTSPRRETPPRRAPTPPRWSNRVSAAAAASRWPTPTARCSRGSAAIMARTATAAP